MGVQFEGWGGCEISFCVCRRGVDRVCLGVLLKYLSCLQKHNYIPYITFTITTVQLHVSAINFGHLQVVHEAPYNKLYLHLSTYDKLYLHLIF